MIRTLVVAACLISCVATRRQEYLIKADKTSYKATVSGVDQGSQQNTILTSDNEPQLMSPDGEIAKDLPVK